MHEEEEYMVHHHPATQTANIMDQFGSDLVNPRSRDAQQRQQRIKRGECPNCRRKTHKVSRFKFGSSRREPLTVEGEVKEGRCLRCQPQYDGNVMHRASGGMAVGPGQGGMYQAENVEVSHTGLEFSCDDDNMTVASELTMDPYLTAESGGYKRGSGTRAHLMSSQFEAVSEEDEVTDFGRRAEEIGGHINKLHNERREREREIVREQERQFHSSILTEESEQRPAVGASRTGGRRSNNRRPRSNNFSSIRSDRISEEGSLDVEEFEGNHQRSLETEQWENHEHLLDEMEQAQQHHTEQQFHPYSTDHNLTQSERSMSDRERQSSNSSFERRNNSSFSQSDLERRNNSSFSQSDLERSSSLGRSHNNSSFSVTQTLTQKYHPLSQMRQYMKSERSISMNDDEGSEGSISLNAALNDGRSKSDSVESSDSDRINRLCQGSRSSMMTEDVEKSPIQRGDARPLVKTPWVENEMSPIRSAMQLGRLPSKGSALGADNSDRSGRSVRDNYKRAVSDSRFSVRRLSISPNISPHASPDVSEDEKEVVKAKYDSTGRKIGVRNETNRFSLTQLDESKKTAARAERESANRFSINNGDGKSKKVLRQRRRVTEGMASNYEMEMNASKNWDSVDILRDAAAEANGEDLDSMVDALFGVATSEDEPTTDGGEESTSSLRNRSKLASISDRSSSSAQDDGVNEVNHMFSLLSQDSSAHEDAALATAITERRKSTSSLESGGLKMKLSTIKDIPVIIETVRARPHDKKCAERAFQSLFLLATDPDPEGSKAREEILAKGGMEILVSAMWDHMQSSQVLLALFHALWAISVFSESDEKSSSALIKKIKECGVLEGLLFAMQSHAEDMSVQESGCDLITRLTGLLPNNTPEFTSAVVLLSGNMHSIDMSSTAYSSCLDALNSLCQLSDENKREFARVGNECHTAIIEGLSSSESLNLETRELACQLFWCVTSDRTAVSALSNNDLLSKKIIDSMTSAPRTEASDQFYSAACGTLANLALDPNNHSNMIDLGVVRILCDAIYTYDFSEDVNSAACTALANLSASKDIRKSIVSQGGISALFSAMESTSNEADIQGEAFRALNNLCESSFEGRRAIVDGLEIIITTYFRNDGVKYIQQITCSIISRLASDEKCRKSMITVTPVFNALSNIMKANSRRKLVQKAACSALSNLSKEEEVIPILLSKGFDSLVIDAMDTYADCEELQESACTFLMNMGSKSPEASVEICSGEGLHCIVKSMQTIPTSASLQQASCGALCAITKGDTHKSMAVSAGAVDAVIYLLLVHPTESKVLENAVNVLASLSSLKKCTKTIADAGGISTVIETMRSHPSSTGLILRGSRFIQHMALSDREYANEALGGITPILGCMDEHPDCAKLVEESCKALRCLVLKSESCKDRVITADGVAVIEKTMEENSTSQRWQTLLLDELFQ